MSIRSGRRKVHLFIYTPFWRHPQSHMMGDSSRHPQSRHWFRIALCLRSLAPCVPCHRPERVGEFGRGGGIVCVVGQDFGILGQANAGVIPKGYRCGSMPKVRHPLARVCPTTFHTSTMVRTIKRFSRKSNAKNGFDPH